MLTNARKCRKNVGAKTREALPIKRNNQNNVIMLVFDPILPYIVIYIYIFFFKLVLVV